jgi:hypothetical protein
MTISTIPGVQYVLKGHRCYEYVLDFVVATSAIGKYLNAYHGRAVTSFAPHIQAGALQYPTLCFEGQASGKHVEFIPHDILTDVLVKDSRVEPIPYLSPPSFHTIVGASTGSIADSFEGLAQAMFTRYYENNLDTIVQQHGTRRTGRWPIVLQFAAVVRDAMSHGGKIHMRSPVRPATYFGLTYSSSDNGNKVLHNELTCADIFYLMLDMDAAF